MIGADVDSMTCGRCGGHGKRPADRPEPGASAAFYKPGAPRSRQRVALLHAAGREGDPAFADRPWRVTFFAPDGPLSHYCASAGDIMGELRGYQEHAGAGRLLDYWSTRPTWAEGMKQIAMIEEWNRQSIKE